MPAVIQGTSFCLATADGGYAETFLEGVNIGAASAGSFPGEFAITKETYLRWFKEISEMNVHVIRVYVNQMPEFYEALLEFNQSSEQPLYLLHGVYANEDMIEEFGNAYGGNGALQESFLKDVRNAVDMVHGNAEIEKLPGNAGGTYTADVSPWTIGWILGIEWSGDFVNATNDANPEKTSFTGKYVTTEDASPFEVFLAEAVEVAIAQDIENYGTQRPVALCNWCTTDPLSHPGEPSPEMEDAASVDVEHIRATEAFDAGFFASYHVYPYYPEFLSYESRYTSTGDPYRAYLEELVSYHSMPVLVSEFGIPASRGIAHENAMTGMSQGHASEQQQAEWLIAMNEDIRSAGCAGGLIFSWQDEWFKRTWNTMDYETTDRRPFWYNPQSPEECFGLLAFEPGESKPTVTIDGDCGEWAKADHVVENDGLTISARYDAAYLYLLVEGDNYDFEKDVVYVPIGVVSNQGNTSYGDLRFEDGAEFLLVLNGAANSRLIVDAYYDAFQFSYSTQNHFFDALPGQNEKDSGNFNPIYLAMNRPMTLPETGERTEFMRFETGLMQYGDAREDSLADFCAGDGFVEVRLPWQLISFMDPSTKQVMGDFAGQNTIVAVSTDGVRLGVAPEGSADSVPMTLFSWDNWELPVYHERLKASYYLLRDYYASEQAEN